jgi:hypothetical protein
LVGVGASVPSCLCVVVGTLECRNILYARFHLNIDILERESPESTRERERESVFKVRGAAGLV